MADSPTTLTSIPPPMEAALPTAELTADSQPRPRHRGPPLNQIYTLPAPIRTFPLPSFYPNNPISLFHLVYAWMKQVLSPPAAEPSVIHTGIWDPDSRSVHITDPAAVRAFWEQGFYGKGNLSRSEPNWLKREQIRRGAVEGDVSEQRTALRREERRQVKWERARSEQEALERTRREEAQLTASGGDNSDASSFPSAPLDPQPEPELSASKSEPRDASNEDTLPSASPVEAIPSTLLEATEIKIEETVVTASMTGEEPGMPLNGVAKRPDAHDTEQVDTLPGPVANHDAQPISLQVSSSVVAVASVLSRAPRLSKAPVGPLELLALPNCAAQSTAPSPREIIVAGKTPVMLKAPVGPLELLALPNSAGETQLAPSATMPPESVVPERNTAVAAVVDANLDIAPVVTRLVHGGSSDHVSRSRSPVGPLELLALPNSLAVMHARPAKSSELHGATVNGINNMSHLAIPEVVLRESSMSKSPVGPLELLALPNTLAALRSDPCTPPLNKNLDVNGFHVFEQRPHVQDRDSNSVSLSRPLNEDDAGEASPPTDSSTRLNGHTNGSIFGKITTAPIMSEMPGSKHTLEMSDAAEAQPPKRRKSVRFSTTVDSTTFLNCDPPSPERSVIVAKCNGAATVEAGSVPDEAVVPVEASAPEEKQDVKAPAAPVSSRTISPPDVTAIIENKEHLQLSAEEAFFLAYGVGALSVLDPDTKMPIPQEKLLGLFRSHSYFPPRQELQPSDPFLVHYAVYHHFRSLGWVPRHGVKFGVDWMLYTRGPVFDHAEFGLIVMPSYSHPRWKENGREAPRKSWHWLHGVNRVLSHVLKSLVLVYVDVPPPHIFDAAMAAGGISATLKEYRVREFMVRRWSSNRNR